MDLAGLDPFLRDHDFTGVVVLRRGADTLFEGAYGLASPRWGVPNRLSTRFDCASVTKLFTSVAVLQQVAAGRLGLDDSIHDHVDLAGTAIPATVTLRHLLTHTSGIADDADEEAGEEYADLFVDRPCYSVTTTRDFLPQFAHKPPLAPPGERCRYCNVGYVLAGLALEAVTGETYRDYVGREVFGRAGMAASGFFDRRDAEPDVAEGFDPDATGRLVQNTFSYPPIGSPDGGAHVTAGDLLAFLAGLRGGVLLPPAWTALFLAPQVRHDPEVEYGFGLEFGSHGWWKRGDNAGVGALVEHFTGHDVDLVVLANRRHAVWPVSERIERLVLAGAT